MTQYEESQAQKLWDQSENAGKALPTKGNGKPDYNDPEYPVPSRWCNPVPYRQDEYPSGWSHCIALQIAGADCFNLGRVPFTIALLVSMVVAVSSIVVPLYLCMAELAELTNDEHFMGNLTVLRDDIRVVFLDMGYVVEDLEPAASDKNTTTTISEMMAESEDIINIVNDSILTLLLMLMMLGTRERRTPEQVEREKKNPHSMSITERIEASIRNYILLKTILSFVTALFVSIVMWAIGVRLFKVWTVLTFILNFIPNVGSMIAIIAPLPIIAVDADLSTFQKILGFGIPALIQVSNPHLILRILT